MPGQSAIEKPTPKRRSGRLSVPPPPQAKKTGQRQPSARAVGAHMKLQRILVPVDFSRESTKALRYAVTLARQFDASITLVHVVEPHYGLTPLAAPGLRNSSDRKRMAKAKLRLSALGQRLLGPCRVIESVIRSGLAFFEITEAAKALGSDLIVVGTHGFGAVTRSVVGSTAEKVIRHAPCPVLVVRPYEHEFIE